MVKVPPKKTDWQNVVERAGWTFAQAFVATLAVSFVAVHDVTTAKAAFVGAVAAGLSAVKTFVKETL